MPDRNKPSQGCIKDFHIVDSRIPDVIEVLAEVFKQKNINAFEVTKVNTWQRESKTCLTASHSPPCMLLTMGISALFAFLKFINLNASITCYNAKSSFRLFINASKVSARKYVLLSSSDASNV